MGKESYLVCRGDFVVFLPITAPRKLGHFEVRIGGTGREELALEGPLFWRAQK